MPPYDIVADNYYIKNQPAKSEELINTVNVVNSPLVIEDYDDELYVSGEPIILLSLESKTVTIKYSDIPVLTPSVAVYVTDDTGEILYDENNGNITNDVVSSSVDYYAYGAKVQFQNDDPSTRYFVIVGSGYPLKTKKETVTKIDSNGILENGVLTHDLRPNHLLQNRSWCEDVAETLLNSFKTPRKDIAVDWRGNLDLDLHVNNIFTIPEYDKNGVTTIGTFKIFKQVSVFDGAFKQMTDGRKQV